MNKEHHPKIITIVLILILLLVVAGLVTIAFKEKNIGPSTSEVQKSEIELLNEATTGSGSSSISDPEVIELNKMTTGSQSGGSESSREALIRATSAM